MKTTTINVLRSLSRIIAPLMLAIGLTGLTGCGSSSPKTMAAHRIADRLPGLIGPAKHYDVDVDGSPFAMERGHVRRVLIKGEDVTMSRGLTVDTLTVDARDISVDPASHKLKHLGDVTFEGTIGQGHLDNYIAAAKPGVAGLSVDLRWNDLQASVPVSVRSLTTTARLSGTLAPDATEPDKLDFVANKASVGVVPLPVRIVNLALDRLNPAIDLSGFRFPLTVSSANVVQGKVVLRGRARIPPQRIADALRD